MRNKTVIENYKEWELVAKNIMWVKEKKWQVNKVYHINYLGYEGIGIVLSPIDKVVRWVIIEVEMVCLLEWELLG